MAPSVVQPTGPQLRAARGLLNMSVVELADLTSLALNTIKRAEASEGPIAVTAANARLLTSTLEGQGIVFIPADLDFGPGVRLSLDQKAQVRPARRRRLGDASTHNDPMDD